MPTRSLRRRRDIIVRQAIRLCVIVVAVLLTAPASLAIEDLPKEKGFSGFVVFGGGAAGAESNVLVGNKIIDVGRERITSLTASPDESEQTGFPIVDGELRYTFKASRLEGFFGISLEDMVTLEASQGIGVRWRPGPVGIFQFGVVTSGLASLVWEDPYIVERDRAETDMASFGVRLVWGKIFGSGFDVTLTGRWIDIESERSGGNLDLNPSQLSLLDRNGSQRAVEIAYVWRMSPSSTLKPSVAFHDDDRSGEAMSANSYYFQVSYGYNKQPVLFVISGIYGKRDADADHPIYPGERLDSTSTVATTSFFYTLPTRSRRWAVGANLSYADENSEIDFHDSRVTAIIACMKYAWK
jgi:hypothetical protein